MLKSNRAFAIAAIRLLIGLALISFIVYSFNPSATLSMMLSASPHYLALAALFYPLMMLVYTLRWRFILSMMGDHLPLPVAYQAITGCALISDFTPGRLGDFLKPLLVKDIVQLNKGLASVVIDHYADALTGVLLGATGLLAMQHNRSLSLMLGVFALLAFVSLMSIMWLKRDLVLRAVKKTKHNGIIASVQSICDAMGSVKNAPRLLAATIGISLIIWIPYALRIFFITKSLGYETPIYMIFFLLPLIAMLSALPITISGMGLVEGGMIALMVMLGLPPSVGISVALMDRFMAIGVNALIGGRYAARLLRTDLAQVKLS